MTEWIRVKDKSTGHEQTINAALFDERDFERLEDKAATDPEGRPLPGKPNANLPKAEPDAPAEAGGDAGTDEPLPPPPEATPPSTKSGRAGRA